MSGSILKEREKERKDFSRHSNIGQLLVIIIAFPFCSNCALFEQSGWMGIVYNHKIFDNQAYNVCKAINFEFHLLDLQLVWLYSSRVGGWRHICVKSGLVLAFSYVYKLKVLYIMTDAQSIQLSDCLQFIPYHYYLKTIISTSFKMNFYIPIYVYLSTLNWLSYKRLCLLFGCTMYALTCIMHKTLEWSDTTIKFKSLWKITSWV